MLQFEVAGTVIQLEDNEAALVIYCDFSAKGKEIILIDEGLARFGEPGYIGSDEHYNFVLECEAFTHLHAQVVGRPVGKKTVYAAIFPRLRLFQERGWNKGLRSRAPQISAYVDLYTTKIEYPRLYAGNVTEVDWTNVSWR